MRQSGAIEGVVSELLLLLGRGPVEGLALYCDHRRGERRLFELLSRTSIFH